MAFELPRLVDLTDDQLTVLNASYEKNMIVSGAPGTGKSVLAIYRAADLSKNRKKTLLLVFNKPLKQYISSAVRSLNINTVVSTYHAWLFNFYKKVIEKEPPQSNYNWDFEKVIEDFKSVGYKYDTIIIDEAQDFPKDLIEALTYVGKTVNCFMDVNQRIQNKENNRYQDIAWILGVRGMYTLSENFRNTEEIYEFAKIYSKDRMQITTSRNGEKPLFVKTLTEDDIYDTIETLVLNNSTSTIGIFTSYGEQEEMYETLNRAVGDRVKVYAYDGSSENSEFKNINFDKTGIFILSTGTMKGLEFDVVIVPRADKIKLTSTNNLSSNTFYVAATRASEELYCLYSEEQCRGRYIDVFSPLMRNKELVDWE